MARSYGPMKMRGSMGETSFKRVGNKNIAYDKVVVSESKRKFHKDFQSTRDNASELGNASAAAKLLRISMGTWLNFAQDSKMKNRLLAEMMKVLKKDTVSTSGRQIVRSENLTHLLGFNFNEKVRLRVAFNVRYKTSINRETGELTINIYPFKPVSAIRGPQYATHFKIVSSAMEIDLMNPDHIHSKVEKHDNKISDSIAINSSEADQLTIVHKLTPGSTAVLFIVLGLQFIDERGYYYASKEQKQVVNSLSLVDLQIS